MKKLLYIIPILLLLFGFGIGNPDPTVYYVNTAADAGGDGTTQELTGEHCAFKTIAQVNAASPAAGDSVLFNKGNTWREQLTVPTSGSDGSPITFGAYGEGVNPIILGSIEAIGESGDWTDEGGTDYTADGNIVAYYYFESGAFDQSGTGDNHVDDADSDPSADAVDYQQGLQSADFEADSSQYLQCATANLTADFPGKVASDSFTVVAWIKPESTPGTRHCIASVRNTNSWRFQKNKTDKLYTKISYSDGEGGEVGSEASTALDNGTWYHVALVVDGTANLIYIYLNGNLDNGEGTAFDHTLVSGTGNFDIGREFNDYYFDGKMDELAIFDRALSSAEITAIKDDGLDGSSGATNVWKRTLATECKIVIFDTTNWGTEDATPDAQYEWDWVSNELFVYATENPTTYYSSIEAGQRDNCISNTKDYVSLDGLDLKGVNDVGFISNGSYVVPDMANLTISYCRRTGIWWEDNTGTTTIDNVDVFYCGASGLRIVNSTSGGTIQNCEIGHVGIKLGWGHNVDVEDSDNFTIESNRLHHNDSGSGVGGDRYNSCIIQNNEINNVYYTGVDLTGHVAGDCEYNIVRYNIIHDNTGAANDAGVTTWAEVDEGAYSRYNEIYYNIIYGCTYGLYCSSRSEYNEFYNNVIYDCGDSGDEAGIAITEGQGGATFPVHNEFKNNIVYAVSGKLIYTNQAGDGTNTLDYNCYYPEDTGHFEWNDTDYDTLAAYQTASSQDANGIAVDPLMLDPANGNFKLNPHSPCINKGTDVSLTEDYEGLKIRHAPDIGAHENQANVLFFSWFLRDFLGVNK